MKKLSSAQRERFLIISRKRLRREATRRIIRKSKRLARAIDLAARRDFATRAGVPIDTNLERVQIVLPAIFSYHDNFRETAEAVTKMRDAALGENRPVMLHFGHVEKMDPSAALVLVAEIFRIRNLRSPKAVNGTYPRLRIIYDLLADMGFFGLLNIGEPFDRPKTVDDFNRPVFLQFISGNRVESETVDRFVGIIENHLFPLNAVARGKLVAAIIEAMNNTLDHAHPSSTAGRSMARRWWMSSRIAITDKEVMILLFDQGVGIPNTLDPNAYEMIRAAVSGLLRFKGLSAQPSDGELIMAATEFHRTSTGQQGRGKGFRNMKQFVDTCTDGELRVLSNRGRYVYISGTETYENEPQSIGGTVIEWRFRHHDGSVDMIDE